MVWRPLLVLAVLAASLSGAPLRADEAMERYFQGLRDRKLFGLAESYALHRLGHDKLTPLVRADLTSELAQTLVEHALYSPETEQQELWSRARTALDDALSREPQNPHHWILEAQAALIPAVEGEWCRWQADLVPHDPSYPDRARRMLSDAIDKLRRLDAKLVRELADRQEPAPRPGAKSAVTSTPPGALTQAELRGLLLSVRYRTAAALIDLAQVLPPGTPDRASHLLDAEKLTAGSAGAEDHETHPWRSRLLFVTCMRLQGDPGRALKSIDELRRQNPPTDVLDRLLAEELRILLARKKLADSDRILTERAKEPRPLTGELRFLQVQLLSEAWQAADPRSSDAERLKQQLVRLVQAAEQQVGGFWSYRCRLVEQRIADLEEYGPELAPLVRQAETAYSAGKTKEAIASYERATKTAFRDGKAELVFRLGYTRASLLLQEQDWSRAASGFEELARHYPQNKQAAQAHLLAAFALGKRYSEKQTRERREEYTRLLEEQRRQFAGDSTAAEATWMLAQLEEHRQQYTVALPLYRQIPRDHERGPAAQAAIARCYERILDRLRATGEPRADWEQEAIQQLSGMLTEIEAQPKSPSATRTYAEVAVQLARILLDREPPAFAEADRLLANVFSRLKGEALAISPGTGSVPDPVKAHAARLRIVSLAGQGKVPEARELLNQLSETDPSELLRILEGLTPLVAGGARKPDRDLGELQLQAALKLTEHRERLQPPEQRRLDECLAEAYAQTGQMRRALEVYERLTQAAPKDKALLTTWSELLMRAGDRQSLQKARTNWQKLLTMSPAGSSAWLEARYQECACLYALDEKAECLKLLKVTRLLYPKLADEKLKAKFADLEAKCQPKP